MTAHDRRTTGSLWRRWDLHVHTPASIVQHYGSDPWDRFLTDLTDLPAEMSVIGINDYLFIDGYRRVQEEWRAGRLDNLEAIFPVVEFRLREFGGLGNEWNRINFHVLFEPDTEADWIEAQFLGGVSAHFHLNGDSGPPWSGYLSRSNLDSFGSAIRDAMPPERRDEHHESDLQLGFANLAISLDKLDDVLAQSAFKNKTLTAIGKTEWAALRWNDQSLASKRDLINRADMVFTAAASAGEYRRSRETLSDNTVNAKLLDCSDAHHPLTSSQNDRVGNCRTWIRAQPTFEGLKHALTEFDHRVFVGDRPPKLTSLRNRPSEHLSSVRIRASDDAPVDAQIMFDCKIPLNPGFVAVVGNKGKGKSALLDVIGLAADSSAETNFTFLSRDRFLNPQANRGAEHTVELEWCDGHVVTRGLSEGTTSEAPERVTYLPQRLLDEICSSDPGEPAEKFARQLGEVLFAHVPIADRLGTSSLQSLIEARTKALDDRQTEIRAELTSINRQIVELERRLHTTRRSALTERLSLLKQKLESLDASEPGVPPEPAETSDSELEVTVASLRAAEDDLEQQVAGLRDEDARLARAANSATQLRTAITTLQDHVHTFHDSHREDAESLGLLITELVDLRTDLGPLDDAAQERSDRRRSIQEALSPEMQGSVAEKLRTVRTELADALDRLDLPARERAAALTAHGEWQQARQEILLGSEEEAGIQQIEQQLEELTEAPEKLEELKEERRSLVRRIHQALTERVAVFEDLFMPARAFIDSHELARACDLTFGASIREKNLAPRLFDLISRGVAGTFTGVQEGETTLREMIENTAFSDEDSVVSFVDSMDRALHFDLRSGDNAPVDLERIVRTGHDLVEVYDLVFGLTYLEPYHALQYQGTALDQLSPGEKGTLLLMFYLLVDPAHRPLLLDQPDENLDNHTIKDLLVPAIKEAADRRQVIVVTHNPNVAIVADADQIIVADRDSISFSYAFGAIEDDHTNLSAVDVLEGTWPALVNRTDKYRPPTGGPS